MSKKSKPTAGRRSRRHKMEALTHKLAPQVKRWDTCRYTVHVSCIDPCCEILELHTDSRAKAVRQWHEWAKWKHNSGGEWMVYMYEHPTDRHTTRKVMRAEPRGWIYHVDYPRSTCLKRHDYMMEEIQK